jgi:Domain of unknown function (DUF6259)
MRPRLGDEGDGGEDEAQHGFRFTGYCQAIRGARRIAVGLLLLFCLAGSAEAAKRPAITFTQHARKATLRVTAPGYELLLSRTNGGILSLTDRAAKKKLLVGQGGCIWGARAEGSTDYIGGCSFSRTGASRFSYSWSQRATTLTLRFTPKVDAGDAISATATLTFARTSFDIRVTVENHLHRLLTSMLVPADLLAVAGDVTAGYAPNFLPGVKLSPNFFKGTQGNVLTYPGRYVWADYLAYDMGSARLALYSVNPDPSPIRPVEIGFVRGEPGGFCADNYFCIAHSFNAQIADGATWTSPVVRIRVGETVDRSLANYRRDNAIDRYPSVTDKLGAKTATYAQAPLIKADLRKGLPPLAEWKEQLTRLPSPALVHPVHFQPGRFDEWAPDFLPPDPRIGSSADFRAMVADAHELGDLVMPYLNVSWWNVNSPTIHRLLAEGPAERFSVLNASGRPHMDFYPPFFGYVVSPYTQIVRDRVRSLMEQWQTETPTDCYFFDQLGARPWIRDYNPASPDSLSYYDGWLALLAPYASRCLMVEDGWDRLAKSSSGFHGGLLDVQREAGEADYLFNAGNWEPYPMAQYVFHDKVLMYQHDLAEQTMTQDPATLTYNVAYGFLLSYFWDGQRDTLSSPWLDVVSTYQRALGPFYAGQSLQSYTSPAAGVTETAWPNMTVLTNWNTGRTHSVDGYGIAPDGFLARSRDGSVVAGTFSGTFDGAVLSGGGAHDLVVMRAGSTVTVHQPLGSDTSVSVRLSGSGTVRVTATRPDGTTVPVTGQVQNGRYVFVCAGPQPGLPAPTYRITAG